MNLKILVIIILLSLCFFFGFNKISHFRNKIKNANIGELKILKYLPNDNKLLFISNLESSKIINTINRDSNLKNQGELNLLKNSLLSYLGIDLGKNKLENIYNNEILISTYENNKQVKDDIVLVFKIKPGKKIDDILNLSNEIDQNDKIIEIKRENKINYLKFIYQTKDDYIIASSDKKLIESSIKPDPDLKEIYSNDIKVFIADFRNQNNILFRRSFERNLLLTNSFYKKNNDDILATTFSIKDKDLVSKSYLINNKKGICISSYEQFINQNIIDKDFYPVTIYADFKTSFKYLVPLINNFEKSFLEGLNQKLNQNILLLNSNKNWIIVLENNKKNKEIIDEIKELKDFNKYSLEKNDNIFSVYSKDILEQDGEFIKQLTYENIFTAESDRLLILSNNLIDGRNKDSISDQFLRFKNKSTTYDFIYDENNIKDLYSNKEQSFSFVDDLNFLFNNVIKLPNQEFIEIVKQSIPEKDPIFYQESNLRIFK